MLVALAHAACQRPYETVDLVARLPSAEVQCETPVIDFGTPEARPHLLSGWGGDDQWSTERTSFVWAMGETSAVQFFLAEPRSLDVALRCWPPFVFAGAPPQTVVVSVNGTRLADLQLQPNVAEYDVTIPAAALTAGVNRMTFDYGYTRRPVEVAPEMEWADPRPLAVAWDLIRFDPVAGSGSPAATLDGTPVLHLPAASAVDYYLRIPPGSALVLDAVEPELPGGAAQLEVRVETDSGLPAQVVRIAASDAPRTHEVPLEVDPLQPAKLSFRALPGSSGVRLRAPRLRTPAASPSRSAAGCRPADSDRVARPHVLVYLIDTLRADHLGSYGDTRGLTPNLDAFAGEAVRFSRTVAASSWTKPSVASIFTGLNPRRHGANGREDVLQPVATLAGVLSAAGYDTVGIITNSAVAPAFGLGQGFGSYRLLEEQKTWQVHRGADQLNAEAFAWLDGRHDGRPFFLYLHATDPHDPYAPPPRHRERFAPGADPALGGMSYLRRIREGRRAVTERQQRDIESLYAAEVAFADEQFGLALQRLRDLSLYDATLILVTSDHGEAFNEHGRWQHATSLFSEQVNVPLIIKFPRQWRAGHVESAVTHLPDILPTLLDYLRISPPSGLDGQSLLPLLACPDAERTRPPVYGYLGGGQIGVEVESLVAGREKLIHYASYDRPRSAVELYDFGADPAEAHDLSGTHPIEAKYLLTLMDDFRRARVLAPPKPAQLDEAIRERLRALGYLP